MGAINEIVNAICTAYGINPTLYKSNDSIAFFVPCNIARVGVYVRVRINKISGKIDIQLQNQFCAHKNSTPTIHSVFYWTNIIDTEKMKLDKLAKGKEQKQHPLSHSL